MKNLMIKSLSIVIVLLLSHEISAQRITLDKLKNRVQNRAADKAESKVNEKVDSGVDKVLDGIFGAVEKSVKSTPKTDDSTSNTNQNTASENTSNQDASKLLSQIMGGIGQSVAPDANYSFQSSYDMKMKMSDKKGKVNEMTMRYMFSNSNAYMGSKIIDASDPQMKKQMSSMEAMIFDFEKNSMYTFMNMNGQKQMMGISLKEGASGDMLKNSYEKTTYTKTTQKRTIAGYSTTAYEMIQDGEKYLVWISDRPVSFMKGYYEAFNRMSKSNPSQGASFAYDVNPELKAMMENGQMMLGMDMSGKDGDMAMEMLKINASDSNSFSTTGYSNMMDLGKIMEQAASQEGKN